MIQTLTILFLVVCVLVGTRVALYIYNIHHKRYKMAKQSKSLSPVEALQIVQKSTHKGTSMVMLGSGGHTSELQSALESTPIDLFSKIVYVAANTDSHSFQRAKSIQNVRNKSQRCDYVTIPRAREVGQSFTSSIYTTIYAVLFSCKLMYTEKPTFLFVNGPGSCVPLCWLATILNLLYITDTQIIFFESFTRVKHLSLTGKILYHLAHRFIVQWPQLLKQAPTAEYIGVLC